MSSKTVVGKLLNPVGTVASSVGISPDTAVVRGLSAGASMGFSEGQRAYEKSGEQQDVLAPPSAPSDDLITSAQDKAAKGQTKMRGRASTMLTGSKGTSTKTATISSAGRTLLG